MAGLTIDNPTTWPRVCQSQRLIPGDIVALRAGVYAGDWNFSPSGTVEKPIIIQPYNNEAVVMDGAMTITGNNIEFRDIEFLYSGWTTRESLQSGSSPTDIPSNKALIASGAGVTFKNCIIHDLALTFFGGYGGDIIDCHIYYIGWIGPDRGHGHAIYSQNGVLTKQYAGNILHDCFGWGFHIWDESNPLDNYTIEDNTSFRAGSLAGDPKDNILHGGAYRVAHNNIHRRNLTYGGRYNEYGYNAGMTDLSLIGNYFPDNIVKVNCVIIEETGNYYGPDFGNRVFLSSSKLSLNRANLTIYNQDTLANIQVDVSSVFSNGDTISVHNVQDYLVDIQQLTVSQNGTLTINMQVSNHTVVTPVGWTAPATTFPQFGCFVLEKQ